MGNKTKTFIAAIGLLIGACGVKHSANPVDFFGSAETAPTTNFWGKSRTRGATGYVMSQQEFDAALGNQARLFSYIKETDYHGGRNLKQTVTVAASGDVFSRLVRWGTDYNDSENRYLGTLSESALSALNALQSAAQSGPPSQPIQISCASIPASVEKLSAEYDAQPDQAVTILAGVKYVQNSQCDAAVASSPAVYQIIRWMNYLMQVAQ